jgi:hypothetical protein
MRPRLLLARVALSCVPEQDPDDGSDRRGQNAGFAAAPHLVAASLVSMTLTIDTPSVDAPLELGTNVTIAWRWSDSTSPTSYTVEATADGVTYWSCGPAVSATTMPWNVRGVASNMAQLRISAWKDSQRVGQKVVSVTLVPTGLKALQDRVASLEAELLKIVDGRTTVGSANWSDKTRMLRARDDGHFMKHSHVTEDNKDVFRLWRTDGAWFDLIKVAEADWADKARMLRARDDGHFMRCSHVTPENRDAFQLWRTDGEWFALIEVAYARSGD